MWFYRFYMNETCTICIAWNVYWENICVAVNATSLLQHFHATIIFHNAWCIIIKLSNYLWLVVCALTHRVFWKCLHWWTWNFVITVRRTKCKNSLFRHVKLKGILMTCVLLLKWRVSELNKHINKRIIFKTIYFQIICFSFQYRSYKFTFLLLVLKCTIQIQYHYRVNESILKHVSPL